ncbi:MAG: deoxyribodipyrimidine photo-lyase [Saprospiraceae bacterium]|nr:deoxyribodipyrimidine photo-lyase [Saprospiraceae bacterium]
MNYAAFWFRRDLRLQDNHGLSKALNSGFPVIPIFIFDETILSKLSNTSDARVSFIYKQIKSLKQELQALGSDLLVFYGTPDHIWNILFEAYPIKQLFYNRDYESYALQRDARIHELAQSKNVQCFSYKDQVLFEKDECLKEDGSPYTVFTAYKNKILKQIELVGPDKLFTPHDCNDPSGFWTCAPNPMLSFGEIGFTPTTIQFPDQQTKQSLINNYAEKRDFPYENATSQLGIHFRFGTISIRQKAKAAYALSPIYFSELLWRDFYSMILQAFPYVEFSCFKPAYNRIEWENNEQLFKAWCEGKTGYPMVDAGMRQLNQTGFMHNRLRMITASFLVKHLLIDWRWGETYFAEKLLDFDLASNNGGWQWAAGCGTDAAPYFRIFNPELQQQRFDPDFKFIKKWVPEFTKQKYLPPIVNHQDARTKCLSKFSVVSEK